MQRFNWDLSNWDVSQATNVGNVFDSATAFKGDISDRDVSSVITMSNMF